MILLWKASSHIISDNLGMWAKKYKNDLWPTLQCKNWRIVKGNILDNRDQNESYDKVRILISYTFMYYFSVWLIILKSKFKWTSIWICHSSTSLSLQLMLILTLPVESQVPFFSLQQEIPLSTRIHRKIGTFSKMVIQEINQRIFKLSQCA